MPPKTTQHSKTKARRKTPRRAFLFVDTSQRDKFYATFGKRVRERREQQGLTQEALAELAGVDRSYLSQVEAGQRRVSLHLALNLASSLRFSIDELLDTD